MLLAVGPRGVSVEVDGRPAVVADGKVEVRGAPGSDHAVRLRLGPRTTQAKVVVTESGVLPARVDLGAPMPAAQPGPGPERAPVAAIASSIPAPAAIAPAAIATATSSAGEPLSRKFEK